MRGEAAEIRPDLAIGGERETRPVERAQGVFVIIAMVVIVFRVMQQAIHEVAGSNVSQNVLVSAPITLGGPVFPVRNLPVVVNNWPAVYPGRKRDQVGLHT